MKMSTSALTDEEIYGPLSDAQGGTKEFLQKLHDNLFDNAKFTPSILLTIVRPGLTPTRLNAWKLLVAELWPPKYLDTSVYGSRIKEVIQELIAKA